MTHASVAMAVLAALMATGCLAAPSAAPSSGQECVATAAGGTPLSCDAWPYSGTPMPTHPDVGSGWACTIDHDDEAPHEFFRLYANADGRLGWSWRNPMPDGGVRLASFALLEPGRTQWMLVPHQAEGFIEFPEPVQGNTGLAFIRFLRLLLHEEVGGEWVPVEGSRLAIGLVNGTGYFAWQVPGKSGPLVIDLMGKVDEGLPVPDDVLVTLEGRRFSAAVSNRGSSFGGDYFTVARAAAGDCWQESLPGAA